MKTKNIFQENNRENKQEVVNVQRMTSLEIAEVAGKQHCDVMRAIRKMEPAWTKVNGSNFALVEYRDRKGELRPCYSLTKTECLYIATIFMFLNSLTQDFHHFIPSISDIFFNFTPSKRCKYLKVVFN